MMTRVHLVTLAASTGASLLVALALMATHAGAGTVEGPQTPQNVLTRQRDPVVVPGSSLPAFAGAPLAELAAFAYTGVAWQPIRFQFDEVEPAGNTDVAVEDGLLDANDELAVMAQDAGDQAPASAWIADLLSTGYPRYDLRVVDPLHPGEQAWVYLFRSPSLNPGILPASLSVSTDTGYRRRAARCRLLEPGGWLAGLPDDVGRRPQC